MRRIGFLFNHDQVHQVAHSLPTALSLARGGGDLRVIVATTNERLTDEVIRLSGGAPPTNLDLMQLGLTTEVKRLAAEALSGLLPVAKLGVYGDNLDFFRSLDALVVAEKTSLLLKTRYGLGDLFMVHTRHGAGDRAVGFDKASAGFDHVLAAGQKIVDRLVRDSGVPRERVSIVGYPKFDVAGKTPVRLPMQANGRPTVLYNPHVSPHLSSWYRQGREVLDYFLGSDRYNLIFAPHVMLFRRPYVVSIDPVRIARPGRLDPRLYQAPHIHIDLGSAACTDMTYTTAADIYLGDVSSQIYEFLRQPRPCLFLDVHAQPWRGDPDFAHWAAGPVISGAHELESGLQAAIDRHQSDLATQQQLFAYSIDLTDEPSSDRAARVLRNLLAQPAVADEMAPAAAFADD